MPAASSDGKSWHFSLRHFTGFGAGEATPSDEHSLEGHLSAVPELSFESKVSQLNIAWGEDQITAKDWSTGMSNALTESYFRDVLPRLNGAMNTSVTFEQAQAAVNSYLAWARWVEVLGFGGGFNQANKIAFDTMTKAGQDALDQILGYVYTSTFQQCVHDQQAQMMQNRMLALQRTAMTLSESHVADILGSDYEQKYAECTAHLSVPPTTFSGPFSGTETYSDSSQDLQWTFHGTVEYTLKDTATGLWEYVLTGGSETASVTGSAYHCSEAGSGTVDLIPSSQQPMWSYLAIHPLQPGGYYSGSSVAGP